MAIANLIIIVMIIFGGTLIVLGIIVYLKPRKVADRDINRIQFDGILTIETRRGSFCFIGFGIILLIGSFYFYISLVKARVSIGIQNSQLEAVVPRGAALATLPISQPSVEAEPSRGGSIKEIRDIQADTLAQLIKHIDDEKFAILVLEGIDKNSFGLSAIPGDQMPIMSDLLRTVSDKFPRNARLQLDIAKAYRSLYESLNATKEEKRLFLQKWGETVDRLGKTPTNDEGMNYGINLLSGLYYQRERQSQNALEFMSRADESAPPGEKYKTSFNIGSIYLDMALAESRPEKAADYYEKANLQFSISERLAENQKLSFWQPRFNIGTVHLREEREGKAVEAFITSFKLAETAGEGKLFTQYLSRVKDIERLCINKMFADNFPDVCTAN